MHLLWKSRRKWALAITAAALMTMLISEGIAGRLYAQAGEVGYDAPVTGAVSAASSQDWAFTGAIGDILSVEVTRTNGNLQPAVRLLDTDGQTLFGAQASPSQDRVLLVDVRISQTAAYTLRVSAEGATAGSYTLLVKRMRAGIVQPTPTAGPPTLFRPISYGTAMLGTIGGTTFEQVWRFQGAAGDVIDIEMRAVSGDLDSYFTLFSPLQDYLGANDSANGGKDAALYAVTLPQTGAYTIIARQGGGASTTTSGQYTLQITLRTPKLGADNTVLPLGGSLSGRLNRAAPIAQYLLSEGGLVAFKVTLGTLHRIPRVRILDSTGAVLASREGAAPLIFITQLPPKGPFYLQISTDSFDTTGISDFVIGSYKVPALANALRADEAQYSDSNVPGEQRWFFVAEAGDLVRVRIAASRGVLDRSATIRGPGDIVLCSGNLNPQFDQVISLPSEGVYQIVLGVSADSTNPEVAIRYEKLGSGQVPFDRFFVSTPRGPLVYDQSVRGALASPETWYVDVASPTTISLLARGDASQQRLALSIRAPDNSIIAAESGQGTVNVVAASLPQPGRYLITAFDPSGEAGAYTLLMEDAGGGSLLADRAVKGVMLPTNAYREWAINAPAGSLINAILTTRTPGAWVPRLYVLDPSGAVIGEAFPNEQLADQRGLGRNSVRLFGVQAANSGVYRVIVAGQVAASFASYELIVAAQPLFNTVFSAQAALGASNRPAAALSYDPAPPLARRPPQVADLIVPSLPARAVGPEAGNIPANTLMRGEIKQGAFLQAWRLVAPRGNTISIQVAALSGSLSPQLTLVDSEGNIVAEQLRGEGTTTTLVYRTVAGGEYGLIVRVGLEPVKFILYYSADLLRDGALETRQGVPLVYGQTVIGEILDPQQVDTYYFYGSVNDVISARVVALTGNWGPSIQITTIDGLPISVAADVKAGRDNQREVVIDQVRLTRRTIFAIRIGQAAGEGAQSGRYHLYLGATSVSRTRNRLGGLLAEGQSVTGALGVAGTEDVWLLTGHAGHPLSLTLSALDTRNEPTPLAFAVQDTAGNTIALQSTLFSRDSATINNLTLPFDGIYRVRVYGGTTTLGSYRLTWNAAATRSATGVIEYGQTVGGLFTAQINASTWNFIGNAGDVVSVFTQQVYGDNALGSFQILAENGLVLATALDSGNGYGARVDNVTLPFTGSYTILVANPRADFAGTAVYTVGLSLQESKVQNLGGTLLDRQPMLGELFASDPSDLWIFSGTAGQKFDIQVQARETLLAPVLRLRDRAGTVLIETSADAGGLAALSGFSLPANGVYTAEVTSAQSTIGRYLISLTAVEAPLSPLAVIQYGRTLPGLIADDRAADEHVFTGVAGDRISATASREPGSLLALILELYGPSGQLLVRSDALDQDTATIAAFALPANGTYRLVVTRLNGATGKTAGRFNLTLEGDRSTPPVRGRLIDGQRGIGRLGDSNTVERWAYDGKKNEVIAVVSTATSGDLDTVLTVIDPQGNVIATNDDAPGGIDTNAVISGLRLPIDGLYTIIISRVGTRAQGSAGNYEIFANRVYTYLDTESPGTTIGFGERVTSFVGVGQSTKRYIFVGEADDIIYVSLLHSADDAPPQLTILDLTGATLARGTLRVGQTAIDMYKLPARGSFILQVQYPVNARLPYAPFTLSLSLLASADLIPVPGGVLVPEQSAVGTLGSTFSKNQWLLKLSRNSLMTFNLIPLTGNIRPTVTVIDPLGQEQFSQSMAPSANAITFEGLSISQDGIYTLIVSASEGQTGTYRLFYRVKAADSLAAGREASEMLLPGQVVTRTLNDLNPLVRFVLPTDSPPRVTIRALVTSGDIVPQMQVVDTGTGKVVAATLEKTLVGWAVTLDRLELTRDSRQWQVIIGREGAGTGTIAVGYSAQGLSISTLIATPIAYNQTVAASVLPTQPRIYQFDGKRGDALNIIALSELTGMAPAFSLETSSGDTLRAIVPNGPESTLQGYVLPDDDKYIVVVSSEKPTAYILTVQRRQDTRPAQITGRQIVVGGNQENGILPGTLFNYWVVQGKQGNQAKLTLKPINNTLRLDVSLFSPDGSFLGSVTASQTGETVSLGPITLPQDGAYQVVVGRWFGEQGRSTGRYSIVLGLQTP